MAFPIAEKLYQGQDLTKEETQQLFTDIFTGKVDPILLGSVLTALKIKGENYIEIAAAAAAMVNAASRFPSERNFSVGEIVGTGGDGRNTINISTMSALTASTLGLHIAKHGNKGVSSKSGASDFLEALGANIRMSPKQAFKCLSTTGFTFLFAQIYHSGMKYAGPVRKALGTRTIFNILGPLTNPTHPDYSVLGVYSKELLHPMAKALNELGFKKAMVVWGSGIDEIATHDKTYVVELNNGKYSEKVISPSDFGLKTFTLEDIKGDTPEVNCDIALKLFSGQGTEGQKAAVAANTAALLVLGGKAKTLKEGAEMAMAAFENGSVLKQIQAFSILSKQAEI